MKLEIRNLYDTWFTEDILRKAKIPEFRIPRRRGGPIQWSCVCGSDRKVLFFQLISDWDEMRDGMYYSCLMVDEQVFVFEQRPHRRFAPTPPFALYDRLGMDPQVFLASAQRMLDDLTRARAEAWAREQASRAADRAAEIASSRSGS